MKIPKAPCLPFLLALCCRPYSIQEGPQARSHGDEEPADSGQGGDSGSPDSGDSQDWESIPDNPKAPDPSEWIFSDEEVHLVEIELSDEAFTSLIIDPLVYVEGSISFAGQRFESVGVRLKGRVGSFRDLSGKASFKIDMNRYVEGQELDGLEKLTFNNTVVDCSFTKERMAFRVFRALGIPASRTGYVYITVNGVDYGLYPHIESVDDAFLERNYDDPSGNLYEAEYIEDGWYMPDFDQAHHDQLNLEEGTDVGRADVYAVTAALDTYGNTSSFYEEVGEVVDWLHHMATMAAEQYAGQNDGYSLNENNYYAYFEPQSGLMQLISWDMDYSHLYPSDWSFDWHSVDGRLSNLCLADVECRSDYLELLTESCDALDALQLEEELEQIIELTEPWIARDPRRECSDYYVTYYQDYMRAWVANASANAKTTWGL